MNTSGGGLSYCHPGMFGIFLIIEAVRQLRGECGDRQVPGAKLSPHQRNRRLPILQFDLHPWGRLKSWKDSRFQNSTTLPWWDGLSRRKLTFQRCIVCSRAIFYPRSRCPHCFSDALEWQTSTGRGSVYAQTVVHRAPHGFQDRVPYCVALIDLEEGFRMLCNVIGCSPSDVQVGMPVQLDFEEREGRLLPVFRPEFRQGGLDVAHATSCLQRRREGDPNLTECQSPSTNVTGRKSGPYPTSAGVACGCTIVAVRVTQTDASGATFPVLFHGSLPAPATPKRTCRSLQERPEFMLREMDLSTWQASSSRNRLHWSARVKTSANLVAVA